MSSAFETNIKNMYGLEGEKWLNNLPNLINNIATQYSLSDLTPESNLSYNYVLSGLQNNIPIILKLGLDEDTLKRETDALKVFANHGAVKILSEGKKLLLLEHLIPGTSLKSFWPDDENTSLEIVVSIMNKLYEALLPKQYNFPSIIDWLTALEREVTIPIIYLEKARTLKSKLINTCSKFKLLHGDLHHYNILNHQSEWKIIDPKGVMGEISYEIAYFIRNPIPELLTHENTMNIIYNRAKFFANAFNISPQRILDWVYVQSVLSWIWALEDKSDPTYFKQFAEMLYQFHNFNT